MPHSQTTTGYILLLAGLITIALSVWSIYQVFTGSAEPAQVFNLSSIGFDLGSLLPAQLGASQAKPTEILPSSTLNNYSNLAAHYFLMSFIANGGFKLATLGVQLLKVVEFHPLAKQQ